MGKRCNIVMYVCVFSPREEKKLEEKRRAEENTNNMEWICDEME